MHLYVAGRGQYRWLWDWVAALSARYYPYKYDKDKPAGMVQLAVRPIQVYEIVLPEQHLEKVLGILQPYDGGNTWKGSFTKTGNLARTIMGLIGKIGKLERIPHVKRSPEYNIVNPHNYVGVMGIGLKKDMHHPKTGIEML